MATSRLEKIGTIYTRITGLLRAGALKYEDRPLWYEIYEAFPPKNEPAPLTVAPLPNILYPEDAVRAKFHALQVSDTINLSDNITETKCQKFIATYQALETSKNDLSSEELFNEAIKDLKHTATIETKSKESSTVMPSLASIFKDAQLKHESEVE